VFERNISFLVFNTEDFSGSLKKVDFQEINRPKLEFPADTPAAETLFRPTGWRGPVGLATPSLYMDERNISFLFFNNEVFILVSFYLEK